MADLAPSQKEEDVMAYADIKNRPSPASLGSALIINGLMIAGIIFAAPNILGDPADVPTAVKFITLPVPKPDPVTETPKADPDPGVVAKRLTQPLTPPLSAKSENDVVAETGLIPTPPLPPLPLGGGTIVEKPPIRIEPVFKAAAIHPKYRDALQPEYPPGLIRQEIEGSVTLRVLVGADGRVKAIEPLQFDDADLLKTTQAHALRKWRFLPATRDGVPVESWREMTVRFQIPR
jgi:periplasmic protein TonB